MGWLHSSGERQIDGRHRGAAHGATRHRRLHGPGASWRRVAVATLGTLVLAVPTWAAVLGFDPSGEGNGYPHSANGRKTAIPSIRAARVAEEPIRVDGILDDPVWQRAQAGTGFSMHEPDRGAAPTEETVFKIAYDQDAIYFAVACFEKDPSLTSSTLTRRDRIEDSDVVSIYVDPYLDKTTGYNFRVNPEGVLQDQYVFNDGEMDRDWDAVWQGETHRNDEGWYAELRIPFSSIRYRPEASMTWGLQVYRWMQGRGEDDGWVVWDRETRGFISRFGTVTGIEGVSPPRQLEVVPYFVSRATNEVAEPNMSGAGNFGADIKYGVTADLTLNATVQPDFGQVEADPAVLNLSPFETRFEEKRPFFIEGARFFQHPDFELFYSKRIGAEENSRIRFASKLTGKTVRGISIAGLYAATDVTGEGQGHNLFKQGVLPSQYLVGRVGKEFKDGAHRINVMQTAAFRSGSNLEEKLAERRDAYTTGVDFDMNFHDRDYNVQGSFVGSVVQPSTSVGESRPGKIYGTGGALDVRKLGGNNRGGLWGRWEGDRLDLRDLGFLSAPDEVTGGFWVQRRLNGDGKSLINQGNLNVNFWASTLYGGRSEYDDEGSLVWSYGRGHHQSTGANINGWQQFRNYWSTWWGFWGDFEGTSRFETRGGPLMTNPARGGLWWGGETDARKKFQVDAFVEAWWSVEGRRTNYYNVGIDWNQATYMSHSLSFGFNDSHRDAQHINAETYEESLWDPDNSNNFKAQAGGGINNTSYVFGELDSRTFDITLRTDILFNRNQSLELYVQPFLSVGTYGNARELVTPDTYDFAPFAVDGFEASASDFNNASVNLNLVYRWEYRPGSTLFLVWTHARNNNMTRSKNPDAFNADLEAGNLFDVEPENTILAKLTYWFSI